MSRTIDFQDHLNEKLADPTFARGYVIALDAEIAQLREENARLGAENIRLDHDLHGCELQRDRYRSALERIAEMYPPYDCWNAPSAAREALDG